MAGLHTDRAPSHVAVPGEGNLYLRGESAVGHELSAGGRGGELGAPRHIGEEPHRCLAGENRRVDEDIVEARVLEVDVEEIAHPSCFLDVIPTNELGNRLRGDASLLASGCIIPGMPRPRSERQSLEEELAELPGQIAGYERQLASRQPCPARVARPRQIRRGRNRLAAIEARLATLRAEGP